MNIVSPSILSADFFDLKSDINKVSQAQMLHIDVMDGLFVPNISIGVPVVQSIRKSCDMFLDVHLMINDPIKYIKAFCDAGADLICFHLESQSDVEETIKLIKSFGKKACVAIKPKTAAEEIFKYLPMLDMVLVMTVEPGFGGQSFMEDMIYKIKAIRDYCDDNNIDIDIEVDGGINLDTAKLCKDAGANVFVSGSFIFSNEDPNAVCRELISL